MDGDEISASLVGSEFHGKILKSWAMGLPSFPVPSNVLLASVG